MGRIDMMTTVSSLYNASGFNNQTAFYIHNGQYINDITKNKGIGYTILYANGQISLVNGEEKVQVVRS